MKRNLIHYILLVQLLKFNVIHTGYFFSGSISSRQGKKDKNTTTTTIELTVQFAYRRDYLDTSNKLINYCDQTTIDQKTLIGPSTNILCKANCFKKNNEIVTNTNIFCTSFSVNDNWSFGYNKIVTTKNSKIL